MKREEEKRKTRKNNEEMKNGFSTKLNLLQIVVGDEAVDEFLEKLFGVFGSISRVVVSEAAAGL